MSLSGSPAVDTRRETVDLTVHYESQLKTTMGYLKEFRESFAQRLDTLDPEAMKEALNVACNALLESYRNGQKSVQAEKREEKQAEKREARAEAPRKQAWKKRSTQAG